MVLMRANQTETAVCHLLGLLCAHLFSCMLQGTNLESVEREEIVVTVGGVVCTDRGSDIDDVNTVSIFQSHIYLTYR